MKISLGIVSIIIVFSTAMLFSSDSGRVRQSALAGKWYPADKAQLIKEIDDYLVAAGGINLEGRIVGLISPHAGYMYSGKAAATGYALIKGSSIKRVIILAPSHYAGFHGASILDTDYYRTPIGDVPLVKEAVKTLQKNKLFNNYPEAHIPEHSIEIQIPFLQRTLKTFEIIPILVGELSKKEYTELADALRPFVNKETLIVASSDFTHQGLRFGYVPFDKEKEKKIPELDHKAFEYIANLDQSGFTSFVNDTGATICGANGIGVLINLMKGTQAYELDYYTSADVTGDWDNSVSYFSIAFVSKGNNPKGKQGEAAANDPSNKTQTEKKKGLNKMSDELTPDEQKTALKLARDTLELWVKKRKIPDDVEKNYKITDRLKEKCGVFVTLNEHGDLRGCIGYVTGREPVYKAIIDNTVNASTYDPRFSPVETGEIDSIEIEISVMTPLVQVESVDEIQVGVHGLMMKNGMRSGLLLPQVPVEWGWNRQEFLEHTCEKAGLDSDCWKDPDTVIYKFSAQVFGEK